MTSYSIPPQDNSRSPAPGAGADTSLREASLSADGAGLSLEILALPAQIGIQALDPISNVGRIVLFSPPLRNPRLLDHIDLEQEADLIDAAQRALSGLIESCEDCRSAARYADTIYSCMREAREICIGEEMSARSAIVQAFDRRAQAHGFFERPKTDEQAASSRLAHPLAQDLPGNRNCALMAVDALVALPMLIDRREIDDKELARLVFPQLFEARESGDKIAIVATRSFPHWSLHFFGLRRMAAMVLPSQEHLARGHLEDLLAALEAPVAVQCAGFDLPDEAAKIAAGGYLLIKGQAAGLPGSPCEVRIASKEVLENERRRLEKSCTVLFIPESRVQTRDGAEYSLSVEVDSFEVLKHLRRSPSISIGLVKTEFLLLTEKDSGEEIWDISRARLRSLYTRFLRDAGERSVTFRLVDEVEEDVLDKPVVPLARRVPFRDDQVLAMTEAAHDLNHALEIMIPGFHSAEQYFALSSTAASLIGPKRAAELLTVVPLIEGPEGRRALRELQRKVKLEKVGIGFGDLCCRETRIPNRDHPELKYPPHAIVHALRDIVQTAEMSQAKVTLFGRRSGEDKVLMLCEAAGIRSLGLNPNSYPGAVEFIQRLRRRPAVWMARKLAFQGLLHERERLYDRALKVVMKDK